MAGSTGRRIAMNRASRLRSRSIALVLALAAAPVAAVSIGALEGCSKSTDGDKTSIGVSSLLFIKRAAHDGRRRRASSDRRRRRQRPGPRLRPLRPGRQL